MSDEANDPLNTASSNVVRAVFEKQTKKPNSTPKTVVPIVDPKSRFLDDLYKQHWNNLCGWLRTRYGSGPPDPEDIAQTAFAKLAAMKSFDNIRHPKSFLYSVAINASIENIRHMSRTRKFIDGEMRRKERNLEEITPERVSLGKEEFAFMMSKLGTLSKKQKELVIRSRFLGQTYAEITRETGWSSGDISRQLKIALISVRKALKVYGSDIMGLKDDQNEQ